MTRNWLKFNGDSSVSMNSIVLGVQVECPSTSQTETEITLDSAPFSRNNQNLYNRPIGNTSSVCLPKFSLGNRSRIISFHAKSYFPSRLDPMLSHFRHIKLHLSVIRRGKLSRKSSIHCRRKSHGSKYTQLGIQGFELELIRNFHTTYL